MLKVTTFESVFPKGLFIFR